MAVVSGVNIPDNKRVEVSLTTIYGVGPVKAKLVLEQAGIQGNPRVKELTETDLTRIREIVDKNLVTEGDLRREMNMNVRRLIDIGSYRGGRHRRALPVRGQRTRTNGRTKRSGRKTVAGRGRIVVKK